MRLSTTMLGAVALTICVTTPTNLAAASRPKFLKNARWETDLDVARAKARDAGKPILIYVTDSNGVDDTARRRSTSKQLEAAYLSSKEWNRESQKAILVLRLVSRDKDGKRVEYRDNGLELPTLIALDSRGRDLFAVSGVGESAVRDALADACRLVELSPGPYSERPGRETAAGAEIALLEIIHGVRFAPIVEIEALAERVPRLQHRSRMRIIELVMLKQLSRVGPFNGALPHRVGEAVHREGMLRTRFDHDDSPVVRSMQNELFELALGNGDYTNGADSCGSAERLYTRFWFCCLREAIRRKEPDVTTRAIRALKGHELREPFYRDAQLAAYEWMRHEIEILFVQIDDKKRRRKFPSELEPYYSPDQRRKYSLKVVKRVRLSTSSSAPYSIEGPAGLGTVKVARNSSPRGSNQSLGYSVVCEKGERRRVIVQRTPGRALLPVGGGKLQYHVIVREPITDR